MTSTTSLAITSTLVVLSWLLPLYSIVRNRMEPSYESALGVPYAFLAGCAFHFVLLAAWVAVRRAHLGKLEVAVLAASFGLLLVLTKLADGGGLSKMTP